MTETEPLLSRTEWEAVCDLIEEVEQDQNREQFAKSLVEWHLASRQFRKVEMRRMVLAEPGEIDFACHAICVHSLLAMGEALALWAQEFDAEKLAFFNINHRDIQACVEDLRQSLREWHHGFSEAEVEQARAVIFGAAS